MKRTTEVVLGLEQEKFGFLQLLLIQFLDKVIEKDPDLGHSFLRDLESIDDLAERDHRRREDLKSKQGCNRRLAPGQHWRFCGETDMGQSLPALCVECGGDFVLEDSKIVPLNSGNGNE